MSKEATYYAIEVFYLFQISHGSEKDSTCKWMIELWVIVSILNNFLESQMLYNRVRTRVTHRRLQFFVLQRLNTNMKSNHTVVFIVISLLIVVKINLGWSNKSIDNN